ncbi:MAG TPA: hypothetical protein VFG47_20180 [Geminicoccaceae bacterium]|nr:hypothetical protein [Geminicoccaceae bacterium]
MATQQQSTGTRDETYDVISIPCHAPQGAETYQRYVQDAEQRGDQELAQFFRDVRQEERRRAERAKRLLAQRLGKDPGDIPAAPGHQDETRRDHAYHARLRRPHTSYGLRNSDPGYDPTRRH